MVEKLDQLLRSIPVAYTNYPTSYTLAALAIIACAIGAFACLSTPQSKLATLFKPLQRSARAQVPSASVEKGPVDIDYSLVFPPSQRGVLPRLKGFSKGTVLPDPDASALKNELLGLEEDYRLAAPSKIIFTGFRVGEVRTLGRFPDYAALSGVPLPSPIGDFDIDKAVARPYRPFRWAYHQTMSFTKMEPDFWLELENTYRQRIPQRQNLFKEHGSNILQSLPGSELACRELMEMALQFLCARYPRQFELVCSKKGTWTFKNHILKTSQVLDDTIEPLKVLLDNVAEDFGIMLRDEKTGRYVLRAGLICSSVGWQLGEKMGLGLPGIHRVVPDYKEKMQFSMDRFFTKIATEKAIQRGSWGIEIGEPLHLPSTHPDFAHREHQDPSLDISDINMRVDWQTLRRLPLSGAVVFSFKALFTPITEVADEPYVPALILKVLNEGKENLMRYKGTWHVEHVVKPTLEKYAKKQVDEGLVEPNWEVETLKEAPFFQGWERKWWVV